MGMDRCMIFYSAIVVVQCTCNLARNSPEHTDTQFLQHYASVNADNINNLDCNPITLKKSGSTFKRKLNVPSGKTIWEGLYYLISAGTVKEY